MNNETAIPLLPNYVHETNHTLYQTLQPISNQSVHFSGIVEHIAPLKKRKTYATQGSFVIITLTNVHIRNREKEVTYARIVISQKEYDRMKIQRKDHITGVGIIKSYTNKRVWNYLLTYADELHAYHDIKKGISSIKYQIKHVRILENKTKKKKKKSNKKQPQYRGPRKKSRL